MSKETEHSTPVEKEKVDALYAEIEDTYVKIQAALDDDLRMPPPLLWMKKMEAQQAYLRHTGAPHPRHTTYAIEQRLIRFIKSIVAENIWMLMSGECMGIEVDPICAPGIPHVIDVLKQYGYEAAVVRHNEKAALKIRFKQ